MIPESRFTSDREVLFVPPHAYGPEHRDCRRGEVVSVNPCGVLVQTTEGLRTYLPEELCSEGEED